MATADEIIEAFLRGVAEGAKQTAREQFPTPEQAGKSIGRRVTGGRSKIKKDSKITAPRRKLTGYKKAYSKHFKAVQGKYKKKNGSWKQDGFKRAQKEAHKLARKEMK